MIEASAFDNASVSALLGALSGGLVSFAVGARSERKGRVYANFSSLEQVLEDLEALSIDYWRTNGKNVEREASIKHLLERVDLKLQSFARCVKNRKCWAGLESRFDLLDEEITGGLFEGVGRRAERARVERIRRYAKELRDWLYDFV